MVRRAFPYVLTAAATASLTVAGQIVYAGHRPLPHFSDLDPSGAFGDPGSPPLRLVALGDSTITGPGLDHPDETWLRILARRLAVDHHVTVRSLARGGARIRDMAGQLEAALEQPADVAVVSIGANDALRGTPIAYLRENLTGLVETLLGTCRRVALAGVGDLSTAPRLPFPLTLIVRTRAASADAVHRQIAATHPRVVRMRVPEGTNAAFRHEPDMFCPDLFHPSAKGNRTWAEAAWPDLSELVGELLTEQDRQ